MNDDDDDDFVVEVRDDDESLSIVSSLGAADNAIILRCCSIDLGFLCAEREGCPNGAGRQWFLHCIAD